MVSIVAIVISSLQSIFRFGPLVFTDVRTVVAFISITYFLFIEHRRSSTQARSANTKLRRSIKPVPPSSSA